MDEIVTQEQQQDQRDFLDDLLETPESVQTPNLSTKEEEKEPVNEETPSDTPQFEPGSAEATLQEMGLLPKETVPQQHSIPQTNQQLQSLEERFNRFEASQQRQVEPSASDEQFQKLKEYYALPKEAVEKLSEVGLEELADTIASNNAKLFMDTVNAVAQAQQNQLPELLKQQVAQQSQNQKYEDAFYKFWDGRGYDLRDYSNDILEIGRTYIQSNPGSNISDAIRNVGMMVVMGRQLKPSSQSSPQPPFRSAANGSGAGGNRGQVRQGEPGFWAQFTEDMDTFDL